MGERIPSLPGVSSDRPWKDREGRHLSGVADLRRARAPQGARSFYEQSGPAEQLRIEQPTIRGPDEAERTAPKTDRPRDLPYAIVLDRSAGGGAGVELRL